MLLFFFRPPHSMPKPLGPAAATPSPAVRRVPSRPLPRPPTCTPARALHPLRRDRPPARPLASLSPPTAPALCAVPKRGQNQGRKRRPGACVRVGGEGLGCVHVCVLRSRAAFARACARALATCGALRGRRGASAHAHPTTQLHMPTRAGRR